MPETKPTPLRVQGVQVKLQRSWDHLLDLEKRVAHFVYHKRYEIGSELNADGSKLSASLHFVQKPPFGAWGGIIGDFIHNLRSGLEHLAWQIVDANGGAVGSDIKFPIYKSESDYIKWRTPNPARKRRDPFAGVDPRAIKAIEAEQPYAREDGDPAGHPLAILNAMWNRDKHQVLVPMIFHYPPAIQGMGGILIKPPILFGCEDFEIEPGTQPIMSDALGREGRLDDGEHLVSFIGKATGPNPQISVQTNLMPEICLDDGRILTDVLLSLHRDVTGVCERLAVFVI